ncbi:pectin lyase-like protein [Aureobasidium subglaciale]|nr:pectin lyase-like protein [Aureobasidium subglaciale]
MLSIKFWSLATLITPLVSAGGGVHYSKHGNRPQCTVLANGGTTNDVPNILKAFSKCGNGGDITFPEGQNYYIASKLNPMVNDVNINWQGIWTFSPDIEYWRRNSSTYPIAFQSHAASFILTGDHIRINGYGTGGIHGNGDVWYTAEAGHTVPGRPMPFVFWNVSDVTVKKFFIIDPPLWSFNIMNGTNMWVDELYCNATATQANASQNWVQNTDGFDTMDSKNIRLTNFVYQGGDDCIAIKPRSSNIFVQNATCRGGNGMAIGSLGQYLEDNTVENVVVDDVKIMRWNEDMHGSVLIKTWVGALVPQNPSANGYYENAGQPRGGGWGSVRNVIFSNFHVEGADAGPTIDQGSGNNGSYAGTSLMDVSNVVFANFSGWLSGKETKERTTSVSCSKVHPCFNIDFENVTLTTASNSTSTGTSSCSYISPGGVHGVSGSGCS